jgi:hypothetical protein
MSKGALIFKSEDLKSEISNLKSVAAKIESPALTLCRRAAIIASQVTI